MSVSHRVTGTWAELTADGTVAIPATPQAGDRMYLFARWKDFSVTATVANWTELTEFADGSTSSGNGTGSVKVACWYRDWQSGDSDPTIDFSANPNSASVVIIVMAKGADDVWLTPVARTAAMTNWTTSSQSVSASATVTVPSSGVVMALIGIRDDTATMTRPTNGIDDSGGLVSWNGNYVESPATHHSTTTGDDGAADLGYRLVTTGAAGATLRMTGTISAAETGAGLWVVQGVSVLVTPGAVTLMGTQFAPMLKLTVTPITASLATALFAPQLQLSLIPASATLGVTGLAPSLALNITPPAATLAITPSAPSLHESLTPATSSLTVATSTPLLLLSVSPASVSLTLSPLAPTITIVITVPGAALTITHFQPHVLPFRVVYLDPGGDATQTIGHFNADVGSTGLVTFDSSQQVVGVGSYKFDSDDGTEPVCASVNGILDTARRISVYFRYDSVPDAVELATQFVEDTATYSGVGFLDPSNMNTDDGAYMTATPARNAGDGNVCAPLSFFDNDIPANATIDSVKIIYERKYDVNTSIGISRVKWRVDGVEGPNHDNTDMPLTDTVVTVDVTDDREWTPGALRAVSFEVIVEARRGDTATEHTQSWDFVKVEVEWRADAIISARDSIDANGFQLGIVPHGDGVGLRLSDAVQLGQGGGTFYYGITKLAPDTDYRLTIAYAQADELASVNVFVNGVPELTVEELIVGGSPLANLRYGWVDSPGVDHLCWFDQLYLDAGDDLQDPGNVLLTAKLPASVNEDNWNTTGGSGAVNERPLSTTNFRQHTVAEAVRQTYTLQTAATGDVDISGETFIGHLGWVWTRMGFGEIDSLKAVVNNAESDFGAQAFVNGTTQVLYTVPVTSTSYPSHAAGIGMVSNEGTADTFLYEAGVIVAWEGATHADLLLPRTLIDTETLDTITDDLRAAPPDSYEVCYKADDFDGSLTIDIYSIDAENNPPQLQGTLQGAGGSGRLRITPGIEVQIIVTVTGVTMLTIWRRLNVD